MAMIKLFTKAVKDDDTIDELMAVLLECNIVI
jgi:hypothetical protein